MLLLVNRGLTGLSIDAYRVRKMRDEIHSELINVTVFSFFVNRLIEQM